MVLCQNVCDRIIWRQLLFESRNIRSISPLKGPVPWPRGFEHVSTSASELFVSTSGLNPIIGFEFWKQDLCILKEYKNVSRRHTLIKPFSYIDWYNISYPMYSNKNSTRKVGWSTRSFRYLVVPKSRLCFLCGTLNKDALRNTLSLWTSFKIKLSVAFFSVVKQSIAVVIFHCICILTTDLSYLHLC